MGVKTRRPLRTAVAKAGSRCFLCRNLIVTEDQERSYERLVTDVVPARVDGAHEECAEKAGLWDKSDDGDDERPRQR